MPREDAFKRLAQLLAERIKTSTYADVLKPVSSFRDIPPESKFWALPTGESVTWPRRRGPHHATVAEEMGFVRPARWEGNPGFPSGWEQALRAGLIRGETMEPSGMPAMSLHLGQQPDAIQAAIDLLRTARPERAWVDVTAFPKRGPMESRSFQYDWSKSGDLMRKLTRLYEASKSPEQFLATLRAMRTMGLLPLGILPLFGQHEVEA